MTVMKRIITYILNVAIAGTLICSCSEIAFGDQFLGDHPEESGATIDTVFNSSVTADKVLTYAYRHLPYGLPTGDKPNDKIGYDVLECITDLAHSFRETDNAGPQNLYYNGGLSADLPSILQGRETYRYGSEVEYTAIRFAWIYIENAHRIPDATEGFIRSRIAEAKTIIALCYAEMLRYVGGVSILDHSVDPAEEMYYPRATFEETVNYIVKLLDEAIPDLSWKMNANDTGRMTKAAAMALKLRVLLFAASPTFNSDTPWHTEADKYTCYGNYSADRWKAAMDAGKELFDAIASNGLYELNTTLGTTVYDYRQAYREAYFRRSSPEVLISIRKGINCDDIHKTFYQEKSRSGATLNYVNMFPWADGTPFQENPDDPDGFNWANPPKAPFYDENGTPTRDPRLYETVCVPGSLHFEGVYAALAEGMTGYVAKSSGFFMMKYILENTSDRSGVYAHWAYLRLPEAMLSYAEAINEYNGGPDATAYKMVNDIRARVGLKPIAEGLGKEQFREALMLERALELGYEEVRWFDLVRWGRVQDFQKQLYGLHSKLPEGHGANAKPSDFGYKFEYKAEKITTSRRWASHWDTKWYMAPIPRTEVDKNYGMTQNPGW